MNLRKAYLLLYLTLYCTEHDERKFIHHMSIMAYKQFNPHPALADYVDAYWTATGDGNELKTEKILPDGCVDIIFNLGADCKTDNSTFTMQNEKAYLVGTMTRFKETDFYPETNLLGIRFKPAAFSAFYKFSSLHELTDRDSRV